MKVQLLVSASYESCQQAEVVWRQVALERGIDMEVLDIADVDGQVLADRLELKTIPAVVIDGRLKAVGVQTVDEARALLES